MRRPILALNTFALLMISAHGSPPSPYTVCRTDQGGRIIECVTKCKHDDGRVTSCETGSGQQGVPNNTPSQGAASHSASVSASVKDWCNVRKCGTQHTMCRYPNSGPAPSCQVLGDGLSARDKVNILNKHNELRQKVARGEETRGLGGRPQPRAKFGSLPIMEWDDTLAEIAQRWADHRCYHDYYRSNHDTCRDVPEYQVGQNIAWDWDEYEPTRLGDKNVEIMVLDWYNEVEFLDPRQVYAFTDASAPNGLTTGHYVTMMWQNTTKLGCGMRIFKNYDGKNTKMLVCNYAPLGLYGNEPIYET